MTEAVIMFLELVEVVDEQVVVVLGAPGTSAAGGGSTKGQGGDA
jgi:hypothetical protein